ncbi:MAG: hypothetical protein EB075_14795, partial [Bacteroidetes bacterium]|nr:hypothetical protein [Bacteroidota bacterium]
MKTITRHGEHWYYQYPDVEDGVKVGNRADVLGEKQKWAWRAKEELGLDVHIHQAQAQDEKSFVEEKKRAEDARKEATEKLGLGAVIDVRGDGGQVVAPGSIHPSGFVYAMKTPWSEINVDDVPVYDPAWFEGKKWQKPGKKGPLSITALSKKRREKTLANAVADTTYEQRVKRYKAWLSEVEGAVEGAGGHDKTFYAACRGVCGFLVKADDVFHILKSEYNPRCQPPWSDEELAHKALEAEKQSGQNDGYMLVDRPEFTARQKVKENAVYEPDGDAFEEPKGGAGAPPPNPVTKNASQPPSKPPTSAPPPSGGGGGGPPRPLTDDEKEWVKRWDALGVDYVKDLRKTSSRPEEKWSRRKVKGVWQLLPNTINLAIVL